MSHSHSGDHLGDTDRGEATRRADHGRGDPVTLLLRAPDPQGRPHVLVLRRPAPGHGLGALPGGTRCGHETAAGAALRIAEQAGADPRTVRVRAERGGGPGPGLLVVADVPERFAAHPAHPGRPVWVPEAEIGALDLGPALARAWPALQVTEAGLLVDAANVVGSRPDGWWRDRPGAAHRLLAEIAAAGSGTFPTGEGRLVWVVHAVVVLEGAATRAPDVAGVEVVRAPGSGDDALVDVAHRGGPWVVVTADRGLRARLPSGVRAVGPSVLRSWISAVSR